MRIFILFWIMPLILSGYASCVVSSTYSPDITGAFSESFPSGAPMSSNLNIEQLALPDLNLPMQSNAQLAWPPTGSGQGYSANCVSSFGVGSINKGCQANFPQPTSLKCNSYYIQVRPNQLCNQAGIRCGEWLTLLSNIGRAGTYWSYEWAQCGSNFCYPEIKNFGNKGVGWHQTWFFGNKPGWHVLSYWCNDWSNYIYIYVWPSN